MAAVKFIPIEGNRMRLDGGAMFGNVPKTVWQKWMIPDDQNRIGLATRALLVQTDQGKNYLFEAGIGSFFDPKLKLRYGIDQPDNQLLVNLEKAGVKEKDIDGVILSHLHFDHAGGSFHSFENKRLLFPNAKYYVGREHWEWAQNPSPRERASFIPELHDALRTSGRLQFIEELASWVTFIRSDGHTRGLLMAEFEKLVFVSDLVPGVAWIHVPITMGYDRFSEKKVEEKRELYERVVKYNKRLFLTHDPDHVEIGIVRDGDHYSKSPH